MATTRKTPQDHKQPQDAHQADDTPQSVTVTVRDIDWTIRAEVMDDMAFLEDLESLNAGNPAILPGFCRRLLWRQQALNAGRTLRQQGPQSRHTHQPHPCAVHRQQLGIAAKLQGVAMALLWP